MTIYSRMRVRNPVVSGFAYPENVVSTLRPQILNYWMAVQHHFKNRHSLEYAKQGGNVPCKNWCEALRRFDKGSGFAHALRQVNEGSK